MTPSSSSSCSSSTGLNTPPDLDMGTAENDSPIITLDTDEISHEMAARLTIALLGQMLYMKGQVPFPVSSLGRMQGRNAAENQSRTATRARKKRIEFLRSYDEFSSHLRTAFVALSTAFAQNETEYPLLRNPTSMVSTLTKHDLSTKARRRPAKVHILLLLGPSPSAAKMRMLLELDGLRVEKFGEWEHFLRNQDRRREIDSESESVHDCLTLSPPAEASSSVHPLHAPVTPSRSQTSESTSEWDNPCTPSSDYNSDMSVPSSPSVTSEASFSDVEELPEFFSGRQESNTFAASQPVEEASLRAGERLLSRTLLSGGEALGFGEEISPTQTHILIRAPRRFAHPTWVPRQNLGSMLDRHVQNFVDSSLCSRGRKSKIRDKGGFGAGLRTVGVRVICHGLKESPLDPNCLARPSQDSGDTTSSEDLMGEEEDELIWWSWDGKLVGFSD